MNNQVPTVDVVVVVWNHARFLRPLLESVRSVDYPREAFHVHIVDNASGDGSADVVRAFLAEHADLTNVTLHEPGTNLGFAGGNNLILRPSTADYAFLLNPDAAFEKDTLRAVVDAAESDPSIGSVQPVLVLMQDPGIINSIGNDIHFAGHGYCRGYRLPVAQAPKERVSITSASGAGVLLRRSALEKVGLLDETLFAYHEDLDLGWRLLLAGYDNVLEPRAILRHHYEFSRSIAKWYWMERNRWIVILKNYRIATLILLLPALIAVEIATWLFAIKSGWTKEKWNATRWFFTRACWSYLPRARRATQQLRAVSDRKILSRFVSAISYQEVSNGFMEKIANPLMAIYFSVLKTIVLW